MTKSRIIYSLLYVLILLVLLIAVTDVRRWDDIKENAKLVDDVPKKTKGTTDGK